MAVGCVKRLVLPWRRSSRPRGGARRRGWSKNLLLVLKFLILCYLAAQTICCQWEYPSMEGERESDREREKGGDSEGSFIIKERRNENKGMKTK